MELGLTGGSSGFHAYTGKASAVPAPGRSDSMAALCEGGLGVC